jgi:hypothetical protein
MRISFAEEGSCGTSNFHFADDSMKLAITAARNMIAAFNVSNWLMIH